MLGRSCRMTRQRSDSESPAKQPTPPSWPRSVCASAPRSKISTRRISSMAWPVYGKLLQGRRPKALPLPDDRQLTNSVSRTGNHRKGKTMKNNQWFSVDKAGLGRQAEEQGKGRLVGELIQNALDEPGVTNIDVTLALVPEEGMADLTV